jgi:hypothetical protein
MRGAQLREKLTAALSNQHSAFSQKPPRITRISRIKRTLFENFHFESLSAFIREIRGAFDFG